MTPEEEQVRRLLADARHREPTPPDVVARLDAKLAELKAESPSSNAEEPATAVPIDLDAARRRRRARTFLVAAAAVVVIGVGIGVANDHLGSPGSSGDSANSADSGGSGTIAESKGASADQGSAPASSTKPEAHGRKPLQDADLDSLTPGRAVITIDPDRFGKQVARLQTHARLNGLPASGAGLRNQVGGESGPGCYTGAWGDGEAMMVRYGHQLGVLVFRPAQGDTQVVDLFVCGQDDPVRSITLPAR